MHKSYILSAANPKEGLDVNTWLDVLTKVKLQLSVHLLRLALEVQKRHNLCSLSDYHVTIWNAPETVQQISPLCRQWQSELLDACKSMVYFTVGMKRKEKEKKRKVYAFQRHFDEKPSIILGCPGTVSTHEALHSAMAT